MNYKKIYEKIIKRAKKRVLPEGIYFERHHEVPKCLSGSNKSENLIKLTAKEHCLCHLILAKENPLFDDLVFAANTMYNTHSCKRYEFLRKQFAKVNSKKHTGLKHSKETKKKLSLKNKGKNNPMFGVKGKDAPCFGRSGDSHPMFGKIGYWKGKHISEDTKRKLSKAKTGIKLGFRAKTIEVNCLFCGKKETVLLSRYKRGNNKYCSKKCRFLDLKEKIKGIGNPFYGKTHSLKTKELISKANTKYIKLTA